MAMELAPSAFETVFETGEAAESVTVIVPLYNYGHYVTGALRSVLSQSLDSVGVIVIDDASTDDSCGIAADWAAKHAESFQSIRVIKHRENQGLSRTRNTGIALSKSPFLFFLDSDNEIYPRCLEVHLNALSGNDAAFAYSILEKFGSDTGLIGTEVFNRDRLKRGNYIDAMACIRREILVALGGYRFFEHGWEDYDLWLRVCELGQTGIHIPEILGRYRVHARSMLRTTTNRRDIQTKLRDQLTADYPWLELPQVWDW